MYGPRFFVLICALIAFCEADRVFADSPSVTAVLSNSEPSVGQTVQLEIKVSGASNANVPRDISVDGLEIHQTGTSRQFEMRNFDVRSNVTYNYSILPLKAGTFRIPPQTVRVGSNSLRTPELALNVADNARKPHTGNAVPNVDSSKLVWAEIVIPKKEAYIGEVVPAEIRVGIEAHVRFDEQEIAAGPELKSQGFTARKWERPQEIGQITNGRRERVFIYKTAIAAAKSGRFEIPAELKLTMQWPERAPQRHSPRDIFGLDDSFDGFFLDPFTHYSAPTEVTIRSMPAVLEVKPLPPNAPPSFSGAVGNFTLNVDAKPKEVQVGDPITVTSTITGRGNFDRTNAPAIEDEHGWHKYPPSSKFKQDDDVGISGSKTFEMVLTPNEQKSNIPPFVFSYFNPLKESYVTLRSDAIPVRVEGGAVAAATPPGSTTPATASSGTPAVASAKPQPKPQDILYQLTERGRVQSFTPTYARPVFWMAQIFPLAALLGFIGLKIQQAKVDDREAQRVAALQQEAVELMRKLRRADVSPKEYFSQASRAVRVKTALARNVDPNIVDAETAAAAFELDETERAELRRLFERSDELRYSGAHNGEEAISPESRRQVLELIENLRE